MLALARNNLVPHTDRIRIDAVPVACVIGILPAERRRCQLLLLTFEAALDATEAATKGDLSRTFDYARLGITKNGKITLLLDHIRLKRVLSRRLVASPQGPCQASPLVGSGSCGLELTKHQRPHTFLCTYVA